MVMVSLTKLIFNNRFCIVSFINTNKVGLEIPNAHFAFWVLKIHAQNIAKLDKAFGFSKPFAELRFLCPSLFFQRAFF